MNKKFLSVALFGALMVSSTGTFVSCKDYDDDITELWDAVNGGKEDLSQKISALEASVSDLQSVQTKLEGEIAAAKQAAADAQAAADKAAADAAEAKAAALQAEKNAVEAAKAEIAKVKDELTALIEANQGASEEAIKAIEGQIAEVKGAISALEVAYQGADKEILDKLSQVETALAGRITNLEAAVASNKEEIGKLQNALQMQKDALDAYKLATGNDLTDIKGRLDKCEEALDALQGFDVAETLEAIGELKLQYQKIAEDLSKINANLELLSSAIFTGVTHVSLVESETAASKKWALDFQSVLIQGSIFGDEWTLDREISNRLEFQKDGQDQMSAKFLMRVSPTNANLEAGMISLQNSKGEPLEIVEVKSLKAYDELLSAPSTRAISKGGLWEVEVALKKYNKDEFNALAQDKDKNHILYAVAVDNTKGDEAVHGKRNIISSYDLTLAHTNFTGASSLDFFVGETNVDEINNRYSFTNNKSISGTVPSGSQPAKEYKWKGVAYPEAFDKDGKVLKVNNADIAVVETNATPVAGDNRSTKLAYPAIQDVPFTISLKKQEGSKWVPATGIKAMYVTFDKMANAIESAPSEWNAWTRYKYEGLDQVVTFEAGEEPKISLTISSKEGETIINDYIGFRVYAVNLDGTLVDPDGRAFYVKLGKEGVEIPAVETKVVAITAKSTSDAVKLDETEVAKLRGLKVASYVWEAEGLGNKVASATHKTGNGFKVTLNAGTSLTTKTGDAATVTEAQAMNIAANLKEATITTQFNEKLGLVLNDTKLNGTLTLKNADGFVLATIKVSITKTLPDAEPAADNFTVKDNQIVNGVYNCYLTPVGFDALDGAISWSAQNSWTVGGSVAKGEMDMTHVFNNWNVDYVAGTTSGYRIVLGTSAVNNQGKYTENAEFGKAVTIPSVLIDNAIEHATKVEYVYAKVSAYVDNKGVAQVNKDHAVNAVDPFNTIYSCYMQEPIQDWKWVTAADKGAAVGADGKWYKDTNKNGKVDANETTSVAMPMEAVYSTEEFEISVADILGVNSYNNTLYGVSMVKLNMKQIRVVDAKIVSDGSKAEDYFVRDHSAGSTDWGTTDGGLIIFHKNSTSTNPTADVASTLYVTYVDMYGHVQTADLKFTVKKQ